MPLQKRVQKGGLKMDTTERIDGRVETQHMKSFSPELEKTFRQIQELAAIREDYIRNKGLPLSLKHLCHRLRIYPTTVKLLAPDLYQNWNDLDFRWKVADQ